MLFPVCVLDQEASFVNPKANTELFVVIKVPVLSFFFFGNKYEHIFRKTTITYCKLIQPHR